MAMALPRLATCAAHAGRACASARAGASANGRAPFQRLKSLPQVQRADEALRGARKRAYKRSVREVSSKKKGPKPKPKPADEAAAYRIELLTQELTSKLKECLHAFPNPDRLHPFERSLVNLSLLSARQNQQAPQTSGGDGVACGRGEGGDADEGERLYMRAIADYDFARKKMHNVGRDAGRTVKRMLQQGGGKGAGAAKTDDNPLRKIKGWGAMSWKEKEDEAVRFTEEEIIGKKWSEVAAPAITRLLAVVKVLRRLPEVDVDMPTIALVGAPNVGKSSLVRLLSSGKPEVREYPFTTKGIVVGHFDSKGSRYQVTDTPGVLRRATLERNAMEMLTLASLEHLPTSVLFVVDPTGSCGTSTADQLAIRDELKRQFPGKPWLDVLSKADLVREERLRRESEDCDDGYRDSGADEVGLTPLAGEMSAMAYNALPGALRVSAVTEEGIDSLRAGIAGLVECPLSGDHDRPRTPPPQEQKYHPLV